MFNGKLKALTFSYDDGVTQDKRLIEIFDKYNLKATFNINTLLLGKQNSITVDGKIVTHNKNSINEFKEIYKNHEIAVHTLEHPNLTTLEDNEIIKQVEEDRQNLIKLVNYEVVGMAYPCGGVNNNDHVAQVIKNNTGVKYSRTITSNYSFDLQENLYRFNPTVYHCETEKMFELAEEFIKIKTNKPKIFYIWGHSYELDINERWKTIEEFCKLISNRDDIYYGTNKEVLITKK
jgi:peptidoglycan/xylan/chitin deacetylase (PgdA/CDA1 family)